MPPPSGHRHQPVHRVFSDDSPLADHLLPDSARRGVQIA